VFSYFILGVALLAGLLLAGRWFATANPKTLVKVVKVLAIGLIVAVAVFFAVTGRLAWALMTLPALLPWFMRLRLLARTAKNFSRMAAGATGGPGAGTGQTSEVETKFLRMHLDHDSGMMSGAVIKGTFIGRELDDLSLDELIDLLEICWVEDQQSAQVLEAYLDRAHENWRETGRGPGKDGAGAGAGAAGSATMTRNEAYEILGLEPGADGEAIKEAHHRLIAGIHPDHGGSTYLAAKINQAKDVLLGR
jgi:hypothetical protein